MYPPFLAAGGNLIVLEGLMEAAEMKVYLYCSGEREELLKKLAFRIPAAEVEAAGPGTRPEAGSLLLVDLSHCGEDWTERLSALRQGTGRGSKIFLIVRGEQLREGRYPEGADDFVVEGAEETEVLARLRRLCGEGTGGEGLEIDEDRYQVRLDGSPVELTYKEFELLRFLASRPGKVFTREVLLRQVWGYDYFGGARTVDVHIRRIRSKIERGGRTYIRTVRGVGYVFEP
jgi:DNA-binding response OmpR family regulator